MGPSPRSLRLRLVLLATSIAIALGAVELLFHLAPGLLPMSYRSRYPPHGVEFFHRGLLDRTPLAGVPLPHCVDRYDGPPPHDLVDLGIAAPADAEQDRRAVPRLVLPADADGFPNGAATEDAQIVLIGDSFTVLAAQHEPPGLQRRVEGELGRTVLNLGISGIGPDRELWLLEHRGLPRRPRLVVWFWFAGNDLTDTLWLQMSLARGAATWADLAGEQRAPQWIVPSLLAALCSPAPARPEPFAGLPLAAAPDQRLWFLPDSLRMLTMTPPLLATHPVWQAASGALRRAHELTRAAGAEFLLVYLPSKEQIYLPLVTPDAALLHRYASASALYALPLPASDELLATLLANRSAQEDTLRAFCAEAGIMLWSATPSLEAAARAGLPAYYATDSHWRAEGQLAVAPALIERLRQTRLLGN